MQGVKRVAASPFLKSIAARLGRAARFALIFGVGSSAIGYGSLQWQARTPSGFWVDFNLDEVVVEDSKNASGGGGAALESLFGGKKKLGLRSVVEAIDEAKTDPAVKALLVRSTGSDGGNEWLSGSIAALATMQEIRSALVRFSAAKKESYAFWNTFGELGTSNGLMSYTFATSCNHVSVMPSGHLSIMGLAGRSPFFKNFLDKWKIQFYTIKRNQYKNALNNLTESGFTKAHRQATEHLLETLFNQCVHDISQSLGLSPRSVTKLIDEAPISAQKAKEANLIGSIRYQSAVIDEVAAKTVEKIKEDRDQGSQEKKNLLRSMENLPPSARADKLRVSLDAYIKAIQARKVLADLHSKVSWPFSKPEEQERVAVVYLGGPILNGNGGGSSTGSKIIDSRETAKVLRRVGAMKKVRAVVLRVNSPGGSVVGSDEIWSAVRDLQSSQKKVVISMGNLAASGGYYISAPADRILASPATLTGSIGVIFGKVNFGSFLEDIVGVRIDQTRAYGKNALMMSQTMDFSRSQKRRLNRMIDEVYEEFLRKVSEGRKMSPKMAQRVASGRVWTGEDAYRLGLVDKLGGIADAIAEAKAISGLPPEAKAVEVRGQTSIRDQVRGLFASGGGARDVLLSLLVGADVGVARAMEAELSGRPALVDPALLFFL